MPKIKVVLARPTCFLQIMRSHTFIFTVFFLLHVFVEAIAQPTAHDVLGFPSTEPGYSLGVSACYAGRIGDMLVVAGGCNFPEQGKPKKYYAGIYAARVNERVLNWRIVGWLPEEAAYGATVESGDSLIFIGGNNANHALKCVYSIHLNAFGDVAIVNRLADLPCTIDNMACARDGDDVYIVGGNHNDEPSASVMHLSLATAADRKWCEMERLPDGPRVQPVCGALAGQLCVWGGFFANGELSKVYTDGYQLNVKNGEWTHLDAPRSVNGEELTLSGGIAWSIGNKMYAAGGVNRDIFLDAISGRYERISKDVYLIQPIEWYRFNGNLCEFDPACGKWLPTRLCSNKLARAGAQAVVTSKGVFYIGGELKPALRTPHITVLDNY